MTNQTQSPNARIILIIDTAGDEALVVLVKGDDVIAKKQWENGPDVGRKALAVIDELLEEKDVDIKDIERIAVNAGPGRRYSGMRSGVVIASMLTYATEAGLVQIYAGNTDDMIKQTKEAKLLDIVTPIYERS